jgi:hypothetical protein
MNNELEVFHYLVNQRRTAKFVRCVRYWATQKQIFLFSVWLSSSIASALSLDTRDARWEEFSREKENYRQRSVQQQFNNDDFLERVGAVRD